MPYVFTEPQPEQVAAFFLVFILPVQIIMDL